MSNNELQHMRHDFPGGAQRMASSDGEATEGPSRKGRYWYVPARSEFTNTEGPFK